MSEVRRHSVDVPLSKVLVALRRVRSLRDPSTNSTSKFSAWETSSCNGVAFGLDNLCDQDGSENCSLLGSQNDNLDDRHSDPESDHSSRRPGLKFYFPKKSRKIGIRGTSSMRRTKRFASPELSRSSFDGILEEGSLSVRNDSNHRKKEFDLSRTPHSSSHFSEDVNSYGKMKVESVHLERRDTRLLARKSGYGKLVESSVAVGSHVGSPCFSMSDPHMNGLNISTPHFVNEEMDLVGSKHQGCGTSCCWSRTRKFQDLNCDSDVEDRPLLSADRRKMAHLEQERRSEYFKRKLGSYSDSPRSLSQKFRPRSFNELVGHHVVTQSLLSAILKGKVAPFYLFHGPRGTGKTSTSRIFAAALNCLSAEELRPCGFCRECILFYSGRLRDVKEVDAVKANHTGRVKTLLKHAAIAPVSSRYKVFIIDECQLLRGETWAAFLNSIEELPRYVVFVMITDDPDKLPQSAVSRCQRYHFPRIRDEDIISRLEDICVEEDLDFEEEVLHFIAAKSNGSLRDAETMLDQLSLLGKRITTALAYELIGTVSDEDLLDLLDLALSSDTSNTVRRARELMKSRVDPMQLISQLANLIMDILAGRWNLGNSAVERNFFRKHASDVDLEKMRHALKILSETEKQLRSSKSQTTWLTVALLQFSTGESSMLDGNDSKKFQKVAHHRDGNICSTSILKEDMDHSVIYRHKHNESKQSDINDEASKKLEAIWSKTIEKCQSNSLKRFLQKEGKLSSVFVRQGLAIAEIEFCHPNHVSKAEKSWKHIASSIQFVLGCNVEIRISLGPYIGRKNAKVKKPAFSLLNCSRGLQERSFSATVDRDYNSDNSSLFSNSYVKQETTSATHSSHHRCHFSSSMQQSDGKQDQNMVYFHHKDALTIRNLEGNALCSGTTTYNRTVKDGLPNGHSLEIDSSKATGNQDSKYHGVQEPDTQPSRFSKTLRVNSMLESPDAACTVCLRIHPNNKLELSIPKKTSIKTYFCTDDPCVLCSNSKMQMTYSNASGDENVSSKESAVSSKLHCWRTSRLQIRKAWQHKKQQQRRSRLVGWILPCSTAKKFRGLN